ncbi:MAG: biotin attachment protein [Desulfovibrionaceae bacterium]|nr:biotin attachment protein [Desulfovibrionaceae bacterium]
MLNITELLENIKKSPYRDIEITTPHTGHLKFSDRQTGDIVTGPRGKWKEKPGSLLATLVREHNPKPICAPDKGELLALHSELEGEFVQAGTPIATIRHKLTREEVEHTILQKALYLFLAPERAKYYFTPEVDKKIHASDGPSVKVRDGMELLIMSRMKREVHLKYQGPDGIIYAIYFKHNENVDAGAPILGVCPQEQLAEIQEVVMRIKTEWRT